LALASLACNTPFPMKVALLVPSFLLLAFGLSGQSKLFELSGKATDTLGTPLSLASVLLLDPIDTTLVTYALTNDAGIFQIKHIKRGRYLLKVSYIGYMPLLLEVDPGEKSTMDMGAIPLEEIAKDLFEVVVRAAKAPMSIRGDTIEYDASKFKVPPGSTVEDLLRRLPGMEVGADGSLSSEGQAINRVTVDGRRFFGGDPKAATKNLPAEGISKVQVFTEETEEKKLTGADSKPPEKMMNLELKDEFKKGGFGKIIAGAGTEERMELKGNYNRFDKKQQFSLIGMGNNTGRNGLGWDDYQDFRGSQAFNWDDGGDFGFGAGGDRMVYYSSDDDDMSIQNNFFGNQQSGFPKNGSAGINYTWYSDKTELNSMYFYNHTNLIAAATRNQENFLPDQTYFNRDITRRDQTQNAHQIQVRLEHKIDSLNTIVGSANASMAVRNTFNNGEYQYLRQDESLSNFTRFDNTSNLENLLLNGSIIYRKKYKNPGRSSAISGNYLHNVSDTENEQESENEFYTTEGILDSLASIYQDNLTNTQRQQIKSSLLHVEPIGKKFFAQAFYNFSHRFERSDRDVFDIANGEQQANDFLSRYYTNNIDLHRLGVSLRYSHQGLNLSVGMARQLFQLDGDFQAGPSAGIMTRIQRDYYNWIPNVTFNGAIKKNQYLNVNYGAYAREPSIRNLQPIVDNSNPLFIREGNPDLIPQIDHRFSASFRKNNPINFTNFNISLSYTLTENQFVQEQQVDSSFVTTSRMINYKGGSGIWAYLNYGFPIIKNKFTVNVNYNAGLNQNFALVNATENETFSINHSGTIRLNYSPSEFFTAFLSTRIGITDTRYSINTSQNQQLLNENYSLNLSARLFWGVFINANFNYDRYQNDRFDFNQDVPILNASLYRVFLPNNRAEVRLAIYDVFNRNLGVSQFANANVVSETRTTTLSRYALLSFTYNLQGINTELKKQSNYY
jgi:hypothetical protein